MAAIPSVATVRATVALVPHCENRMHCWISGLLVEPEQWLCERRLALGVICVESWSCSDDPKEHGGVRKARDGVCLLTSLIARKSSSVSGGEKCLFAIAAFGRRGAVKERLGKQHQVKVRTLVLQHEVPVWATSDQGAEGE